MDAIPHYSGRPIIINDNSSYPAHIIPNSGADRDSQLYANTSSYRKPTFPHPNPMQQPPDQLKPQQPDPIQQASDELKYIGLRSPENTPPKSTIEQPQPPHVPPATLDYLSNKAARTANNEKPKADVKIDTSLTLSTEADPPNHVKTTKNFL